MDEPLQMGDILLVIGSWRQIRQLRQLQQNARNFVVLSLPAEVDDEVPALSQAPMRCFVWH